MPDIEWSIPAEPAMRQGVASEETQQPSESTAMLSLEGLEKIRKREWICSRSIRAKKRNVSHISARAGL